MASKKLKLKKLTTKKIKKLRRDKRLLRAIPFGLLLVGLIAGMLVAWLQPINLHPKNLVWAADENVTVPADLVKYLSGKDDCKGYHGSSTSGGVGLWGIYQTSQNKFAKISYGCSTGLTTYVMVIKEKNQWTLLQPTEYFASRTAGTAPVNSFLPKCEMIERYKIDSSIEPFCIQADGSAKGNAIKI